MSLFDIPVSLTDAVQALRRKELMPTSLSSAELRQLASSVRNQSLFSSRTLMTDLLDKYKTVLDSVIQPQEVDGVLKGMNPAKARATISDFLKQMGYTPEPGKEGTLQDLASSLRINLVIKTNTQTAQGAGLFLQQNSNPDVVDLYPAAELYRIEDKTKERNWKLRWNLAAQVANDPRAAGALGRSGRFVALKSSGIWQALGDGAGGFDDTLGNPYPPFAFNSGMWTKDVSRKDAVALGLMNTGDSPIPALPIDFADLFGLKQAA
jgi:hypothetical protein